VRTLVAGEGELVVAVLSVEPCQSMWSSPSEVTTIRAGAMSRSTHWKLETSSTSQPLDVSTAGS